MVTEDDKRQGWRTVAIDRFYTGVALLLQPLQMKIYAVGAIITNRIGYCKGVINNSKRRTNADRRGSFKMSRAVGVPSMIALSLLDNKPVHFLSTGAVGSRAHVTRRQRGGDLENVPYPAVVSDYHRLMGSVDRHDQLRLQRVALQTCFPFRKYYKSIFMGLIDLATVNVYVTHVKCVKHAGVKPMTRAAFMMELHIQLVKLVASDFAQDDPTTPSSRSLGPQHTIQQNQEFRVSGNQRMRRRNACKVCSIKLRPKGQKSNESSWFCVQWSEDNKWLFLCNTIRASQGNTKTCFDIWHQDWRCKVPATARTTIQMRPTTGQRKRKRVRRSLHQDDEEEMSGSESE